MPVSIAAEAELAKLLENTFRHVNIALVNELAMFAHDLGVDVWEAIDAASTKPFGFMRFTPGPGVGGHCLPIDPSYLSWRVKRDARQTFRFVELANDVNEHMPDYVVAPGHAALNRARPAVNGSRMLLLGLAYKRNTGDGRESPSIVVAERLVALGAEVGAADPHVRRGQRRPPARRSSPLTAEEVGRRRRRRRCSPTTTSSTTTLVVRHAALRLRHPPPRHRPQRRAALAKRRLFGPCWSAPHLPPEV